MGKSYDKDYILKEKRYYLLHKCDIGNAALYLSDQSGLPVRSYSLGALGSGEHRFTISTNLRNGLYVVSMKADDLRGHTTIMLK
jgi:hypothetical protein